jgi:diacylglycerol kinase
MKNKVLYHRFGFALAGLIGAWQREKSFRTEVFFVVVALLVTIAIRPGPMWTAIVVISIALVLALELVNSALEYLIDHLHPQVAPEIKVVKDIASAAVLMVNSSAIIVSLLLLWAWYFG